MLHKARYFCVPTHTPTANTHTLDRKRWADHHHEPTTAQHDATTTQVQRGTPQGMMVVHHTKNTLYTTHTRQPPKSTLQDLMNPNKPPTISQRPSATFHPPEALDKVATSCVMYKRIRPVSALAALVPQQYQPTNLTTHTGGPAASSTSHPPGAPFDEAVPKGKRAPRSEGATARPTTSGAVKSGVVSGNVLDAKEMTNVAVWVGVFIYMCAWIIVYTCFGIFHLVPHSSTHLSCTMGWCAAPEGCLPWHCPPTIPMKATMKITIMGMLRPMVRGGGTIITLAIHLGRFHLLNWQHWHMILTYGNREGMRCVYVCIWWGGFTMTTQSLYHKHHHHTAGTVQLSTTHNRAGYCTWEIARHARCHS